MIRQARLEKAAETERGFRLRGQSVSRLEAFSDAVFGLAVTLVVVGEGSGRSFDEILRRMESFLAIGVCFATVFTIWNKHYLYCRRFGLEDTTVSVLTCFLLFVVALYAYPLKVVYGLFIGNFLHLAPPSTVIVRSDQIPALFIAYGIGWLAVNSGFAALYLHAFRKRALLELSPLEEKLTWRHMWLCLSNGSVGLISIAFVLLVPPPYAGLGGFAYALIGVVEGVFGGLEGKVLEADRTASESTHES